MKRHVLSHLARAFVWQSCLEHAASTPAQPACSQRATRVPVPAQRVPTQSVDTYMTQHTAPSAEAAPVVFCVYGSRRYVVAASARGSLAVACRARAALGLALVLRLRALCLSVSARPALRELKHDVKNHIIPVGRTNKIRRRSVDLLASVERESARGRV